MTVELGAKLNRDSIKEGSDVYFECFVNANPWISEIQWLYNGAPIANDPLQGILITNQSLVLQRVKRQHRGYYQCAATNTEGTQESNRVFLRVQCKSQKYLGRPCC